MEKFFVSKDGRVRVGWRVLAFLFAYLVLAGVLIFASTVLLSQIPFGTSSAAYLPLIVPFVASSAVAIGLGWLAARLFEDLPRQALGISFSTGWLKHLGLGAVIGSLSIASAVLIAAMGGGLQIEPNRDSSGAAIVGTLWTTLVIFTVGALSEETLFRGFLMQTFVRSKLTIAGVALTSLLFAFAHNNNPGANPVSLLNTLLAGVWFAIAYLKTRDLWLPLGIHLMWNWLQGPVFGINVSGISDFSPDPILRATDNGPTLLTGGSYGIEGGIACTVAIAISIGLVYLLPIKPSMEMLALSTQRLKPSGS